MKNSIIRIGEHRWLRTWDVRSIEVIDATVRVTFDDVASARGMIVVNCANSASAVAMGEAIAEEVNKAYSEAD